MARNETRIAADRILIGDVVTMDGKGTRAEAIAIAGGYVLHAGSKVDVLAHRKARTEVFDFGRAAIIPGFNDTHAHLDTEGLKLTRPSLGDVRSIADVVERVRALAATTANGSWIVTRPVGTPPYYHDGPALLAEGRLPNHRELDRAAPDHPVCILPPSGFWGAPPSYMALNSLALRLNGIDASTEPRLQGIEILKDPDGTPNGIFVDHNPRESVQLDLMPAVPAFGYEERRDGVRRAMRLYHEKGTTSVYEGHGCSPEIIQIYRELWEAGELSMRVGMVINPPWPSVDAAEDVMRDWLGYARGAGLGDSMFRISGVHITYGGNPVAAALARERGNATGYWSNLWQYNSPTDYERLCAMCARQDLRVHTTAPNGIQCEIIPILQRVDQQYGIRSRRWVLEHLSRTRMDELKAMEELGLAVTLIPAHFLWKHGTIYAGLDPSEAELVVPARQLQELGVPCAAGTDNTPYDPLITMAVMMLREDRATGQAIGPAARLSAESALALMTLAGSWLTYEEHKKGRLLRGHYADCAVLSNNPLDTDPRSFEDIICLATMVGGAFVFGP